MSKSILRQCGLASGLLRQEDIALALRELGASESDPESKIPDDALAEKLITIGKINRWQSEQLRAGRTKFNLGPYNIVDSIGAGGMGQVFKAEHNLMGRTVAVKVLPRSKMTDDAIASFTREIRTQAQLDHEHLVRAYDAGHDGNVYFLVTEYVAGTDLRRFIRTHGRLSGPAAASVISQAAQGLEHAHRRGLIHRDVKPGNILVTPEGRVKVSDLGLAAFFQEDSDESIGKKIVGTADYLAPEQIMAPDKLSPTSDIYSLGCTLYYCVTGKVPFPGGKAREKARAHCSMQPLDPRRLNPELDDGFVDILADMMAKNPDERIATAGEVAELLAPWAALAPPTLVHGASGLPPLPTTIPARPHVPGSSQFGLEDTAPEMMETNFLVEPRAEHVAAESTSQISLGTDPVIQAMEETFPALDDIELEAPVARREEALSPRLKMFMMVGGGAAALALLAVLVMLVVGAL